MATNPSYVASIAVMPNQAPPVFLCPVTGCGRKFQDPNGLKCHHFYDHGSVTTGRDLEPQNINESNSIGDCSEITDPVERRRVQNRIAQRKFRDKVKEVKEDEEQDLENRTHAGHPAYLLDTTAPAASIRAISRYPLTPVSASPPIENTSSMLPTSKHHRPTAEFSQSPVVELQVINAEWVECPGQWPPHIESSLKKLMILHELYAYPEADVENEPKMWRIFVELRTMVEAKDWEPRIHDERLWGLFQMKVGAIRAQMLRSWEVSKSAEGYMLSERPFANPRTRLPLAREPLVAYPGAPILPRVQCPAALETWKFIDADTQTKLFRKQIRSAKDPQSLIFEWDQFFGEVYKKEPNSVIETDESNRSAKKAGPSCPLQGRSPPATPQPDAKPTESKLKNLKTILEDRIREVKLKRESEKRKLVELDEQDELSRRKCARP